MTLQVVHSIGLLAAINIVEDGSIWYHILTERTSEFRPQLTVIQVFALAFPRHWSCGNPVPAGGGDKHNS